VCGDARAVGYDLGSKMRAGLIADFALAGLCFLLLGELTRREQDARKWLTGSHAERELGVRLEELKWGWLVLHGYMKDRGGDIVHILCGPTGVYAIETKSYGFCSPDVGQTASNAWWLRARLGIGWVTGVVCVSQQRPPPDKQRRAIRPPTSSRPAAGPVAAVRGRNGMAPARGS
jgi:hypothetical protein